MIIKAFKRFTLKNDGPWGPINDGKGNNKPKKNSESDFDESLKKAKEFWNNLLTGKGKNSNNKYSKTPEAKPLFGIIILVVISLWLGSGFYKVDSDENAVVMYLGKFYAITTPGLNYRIPYPFSEVIKKSVIKVNTEDFGTHDVGTEDNYHGEGVMLTGDENIVDIDFQVQWQISDIKDYVFNISDNQLALKKSAESSMREIIAKTPIAGVLSDKKQQVEQQAKILLQEILDSYGAGIKIVLVQLLRVDPPKQVIDSFRDVQTARADKEKEINQAQAYSNDITPRARGEAAKMIQEAEAYKESVIADATGQSSRFISIYQEYARARDVTKRRIFLETMEKIYEDMDKIIIDNKLSKSGVVPYLPLNELKKEKTDE